MIARCLSKAFLFFRLLLLFAAAGILFLHAGQAPAQAADEAPQGPVNPHWTGKNCIECHTEESPKGRGAPLKFAGDPVALCARCHKTGLSCTDIHPVGVAPTPDMEPIFPRQWPLQNGKVSCLTCHDVLCQMSENSAAKAANFKFIRGAPYESLTDFCFICHRKEQYKKTNPHTIQFQGDRINEDSCLFCHQSLPDPDLNKNIGEVSFKGELLSYCINCHPEQKQSHPAQGNHMVRLPDAMKDSLSLQLTENSIDFPLDNGTIICSTCHNPHQKGVLHRKEAQPGAGEPAFLRRSRGYELCVSCHTDKRPKETDNKTEEQQAQTETVNINSIHKPIKENKCKKCHVITVTSRDKPDALNLCFREGCHKTEMIERQFTHDKSVLTKCYFCHTGHASSYQRLLVLNEERLCRGCHPHLRDKTGKLSQILESDLQEAGQDNASSLTFGRTSSSTTTAAPGAPEQPAPADTDNKSKETGKKETHALFIEFLGKSTVVPRENRCGFCHQKGHSSQLATTDIRACAECHIFVQTTLSKSAGRVLNVHQKFGTKVCSQCHDPHSAQYNHLLKLEQPTDYYFAREMKDLTIPAEKLSELDKAKQDEKKAKEQEKKFKKKRKKR